MQNGGMPPRRTRRMKLLFRLKVASMLFWFGLFNAEIFSVSMFKTLSKLLEYILKVAADNKPYFTQIGLVHTGHENAIVTIWASPKIGDSPLERIEELLRENQILKCKIESAALND
jgi:hypothetical protein